MNSDQVALIRHSFAQVRPIAQEAAALFYGRLFEIAPDVKPLFQGDLAEQGRKLMATLAIVVNGLSDLESILPAASALAKKHVSYGVRAEHYAPVGAALLWTLERGLGDDWTSDLGAAWTDAYTLLSEYMIDEAYGRCEAAE
jgi:hemoglobin-like flavoprotein